MLSKKLETDSQRERRERNEAICARFQALREEYPEAKAWRICQELEKEFNVGGAQIHLICKNSGVC